MLSLFYAFSLIGRPHTKAVQHFWAQTQREPKRGSDQRRSKEDGTQTHILYKGNHLTAENHLLPTLQHRGPWLDISWFTYFIIKTLVVTLYSPVKK